MQFLIQSDVKQKWAVTQLQKPKPIVIWLMTFSWLYPRLTEELRYLQDTELKRAECDNNTLIVK